MSSDILTCRCRHCGNNFPYLESSAGASAECPECHNTVLLPGRMRGVAAKRRARLNTPRGVAMEVAGFLLLVWWPIGTVLGGALLFFGWKKNAAWQCSGCDTVVASTAKRCSGCGAAFSSE